jgi:hypothetical protein
MSGFRHGVLGIALVLDGGSRHDKHHPVRALMCAHHLADAGTTSGTGARGWHGLRPSVHERIAVDFWDLTKLLFRRWYFALPGLVLTAIASVWVLVGVAPSYISTAYIQLAPPISQPTQPGQQSLEQRNPWIGLGLTNLADAALLTVQQDAVMEAFKANGLSDTYTATLTGQSPLVTFEVTGATKEQALNTANELIQRFSASVTDLQVTTYGVGTQDLVAARRIDLGANVKESDARVKRAFVAVFGVGLLLTFALTVAIDAWLNRRARRFAGLSDGLDLSDFPPAPVAPTPPARRASSARFTNGTGAGLTSQPQIGTNPRRRIEVHPMGVENDHGSLTSETGTSAGLPALIDGHRPASDDTDEPLVAASPDATVVLPLTHKPARRRPADGDRTEPR